MTKSTIPSEPFYCIIKSKKDFIIVQLILFSYGFNWRGSENKFHIIATTLYKSLTIIFLHENLKMTLSDEIPYGYKNNYKELFLKDILEKY